MNNNGVHPSDPASGDDRPLSLKHVVSALGADVAEFVDVSERGASATVATVALIDTCDLLNNVDVRWPHSDLYLHIGADDDAAARWIQGLRSLPPTQRPKAVLSKLTPDVAVLREAAALLGLGFIGVHPHIRLDRLYLQLLRLLETAERAEAHGDTKPIDADADLFVLAQTLADSTGGMVSIENDRSRVLAYSASANGADHLRVSTIVGRDCPPDYLDLLGQWGVFKRLRRSEEVIEIPDHPHLGIKRRLVTSIRRPVHGESTGSPTRFLGSIWLQEGDRPLAAESREPLRGAATMAGRIIASRLDAPSVESRLINRLLGISVESAGVPDPSCTARDLGITADGPAAVIGLAPYAASGDHDKRDLHRLAGPLRLHVSSFRHDGVSAVAGQRAYAVLPGFSSSQAVRSWLRALLDQLEWVPGGQAMRAALVLPVGSLAEIPDARREVDRVLNATDGDMRVDRITTMERSRTTVLLREAFDLLGREGAFSDPRVAMLGNYDQTQGSQLRSSVKAYLHHFGDVRAAATSMNIHSNTLRYRIRRAEEITGFDLRDPSDRLLLQLHLALSDHGRP